MLAKYPRHVSTLIPLIEWFCPVHINTFLVNIAGGCCRCPDCDRFKRAGEVAMTTTNGIRLEVTGRPDLKMMFVKGHVRLFITKEGHGEVGHGYFVNIEKAVEYLQDNGFLK